MNETYTPRVGEKIKAFHPRKMGVVDVGRVVKITPTLVRVDFGELAGGKFHVPREHVVGPAD